MSKKIVKSPFLDNRTCRKIDRSSVVMAYGIFGARRGVGDCMALLNEVSASLRGKGLESHSIPLIQRSLASMQAKVDELAQLLREQFSPAAQVVLFDCEWYADPANFTKIPEATTAEEQKDATA